MVVGGLDPGTDVSSLVVWNGIQVLSHCIEPNISLLGRIQREPIADVLVIEKFESFGMPVGREAFETVFFSGRIAEAWESSHLSRIVRLGRRDIKLHLCGHSRATDANIRRALLDRIGPIGTVKAKGPLWGLKGHEFAALAVAVTYHDQVSVEDRSERPSIADF